MPDRDLAGEATRMFNPSAAIEKMPIWIRMLSQ